MFYNTKFTQYLEQIKGHVHMNMLQTFSEKWIHNKRNKL